MKPEAAKAFFEIPYYHDYISPVLARDLLSNSKPVDKVDGLREVGSGGGLETPPALQFLVTLYSQIEKDLAGVLALRVADRKFIDERVRACFEFNKSVGREISDPDYRTIEGLSDGRGRIVLGPKTDGYARGGGKPVAPLPEFLKGPHVTLFGPPDSAKMAINAMNAFHRKTKGEPSIVGELLGDVSPMWGADDEDSKTPLRTDLVDAAVNLTACFDGCLSLSEGDKKYDLAKDHLALPIKRFPGLALPSTFLFYRENPIPLHLYDFALHLYRNWQNPRALVFYVPKLENEEEAAYIHKMIASAERLIKREHPSYQEGSVRLMIVLENPRAILRAHEIMDALHPYFAGASLGWHDYLASTARIFKEDGNYRIPVKADPGIVIKYIKASHHLLAETVGSRGGVRVGGMYGILPTAGDAKSLQITLKGFIKDVVTQLKRGLNGFWVAHPDFVRIGLAIVEAWRRRENGDVNPLEKLVTSLLDSDYHQEILGFIRGPDIEGLNPADPGYVRSLIVADIKESDFIANNHPDEIRYNVFQSLQYLADWLSGNGCVALPTHVEKVAVRVMDDLATAERSRWEVWHELRHGRFKVEDFIKIAHEEMNFIRRGLKSDHKATQVAWDDRTKKWYPVALKIMLKLMTDEKPPEFATELLMPFTVESIRASDDPLAALRAIDASAMKLEKYVADFDHYFEICGSARFARTMAKNAVEDLRVAQATIASFTLGEIIEAASFHGNIGDSGKVLDARAAGEQSLVLKESQSIKDDLISLGDMYLKKFGVKFLISAQGKSAEQIRDALQTRLRGDQMSEETNARDALWEISRKRLLASERRTHEIIEALRLKYGIEAASIALSTRSGRDEQDRIAASETVQNLAFGTGTPETEFEIASLSKTLASAFALEYFAAKGISLSTSVNSLFEKTASPFRLTTDTKDESAKGDPSWADQVTITHLMNHTALNMHYVNGFNDGARPRVESLLRGEHGYVAVKVIAKPGRAFHYSGGGFLVLEHLIEALEKKSVVELTKPFFQKLGLKNLTFDTQATSCERDLDFPAFAAGAFGTAHDMQRFLTLLTSAYHDLDAISNPQDPRAPGLSHDTAVTMLHTVDRGAREFMGCEIGLGVFVAEAGSNRIMIHQGANEGFRALYAHCFKGPDQGRGFTIFARGDNEAVSFIAEVARILLIELDIGGVDFSRLEPKFKTEHLKQEEIVNVGYKTLVFDAFEPDLPEEIVDKGPVDPLAPYNLATQAKVTGTTNQKFARAENLISSHLPIFDPELFGRQGKVMDSWESARHNPDEFDTLTLKLKSPSSFKYISFSTKYHDGNHAEFVRLEGFPATESKDATASPQAWQEIVAKTSFKGHALLQLKLSESASTTVYSHVRLSMYPDGGISRLGLYKELPAEFAKNFAADSTVVRFSDAIPRSLKPLTIPYQPKPGEIERNLKLAPEIDWASAAFGGSLAYASNEHYGPAAQVISPFPPIHMFDGLETARSRKPNHHEEVTVRLGRAIQIGRVEFDFKFFVNNNPAFISIEARRSDSNDESWTTLATKTSVKAFASNQKRIVVQNSESFDLVRVRVYPDGGVHRIKVFERRTP